ncbi:MAG: hypothetical protein JWL96_1960 [Sphingomonas bacterium]|uniref:PAS domain-containing protein n=1 Tax=Sphingomonas bacterium TaxID=1895847 RepID=UPI002632BF76|nr:hypothetical protein [Sphingomonas bacterium]MDB5709890.1 hypothetical protein [Sphingomonas bacterium]
MDNVRGFDDENRIETGYHDDVDDSVDQPQIDIGSDERRMHVRAYNHWVSLLRGRAYPLIEDLDPDNIADFGPHSVLLDFSQGIENPAIAFLGRALREECALDTDVTHIAQVPARSLLSRLTDHYLQIIANRAPIGFEAEFVGTRGHNTMYRGILMPFSSDDDSIDFIYGVINWKELVDAETQARLDAELDAAVRTAPRPVSAAAAPVWADGPSAGFDEPADDEADADDTLDGDAAATLPALSHTAGVSSLSDRLILAQQTAAAARAADTRTRATLYRALERAHDFAAAADSDPAAYEALLDQAGIAVQLRAPMTPVVKLIFGADYDKTRLTEYAAVLSHARRHDVPVGSLAELLDAAEGGIKGVVRAERAARAPAVAALAPPDPRSLFDGHPVLASVALDVAAEPGSYVVLVARVAADGRLDVVAKLDGQDALVEKVIRAAAK